MGRQKPQHAVSAGLRGAGASIPVFTTTANAKRETERYKALRLASRVEKMLSYSHGMQKVRLATSETQALGLTTAGQQYIQVGDSLVKAAGSENHPVPSVFGLHGGICFRVEGGR